jgi:Tfp pilus assembly protein FimT
VAGLDTGEFSLTDWRTGRDDAQPAAITSTDGTQNHFVIRCSIDRQRQSIAYRAINFQTARAGTGFNRGTDTASWHDKSWVVGISLNGRNKTYDWNRPATERY